ncbi:hypothetical protein J6590_074416 [Homalodisca vitripennis]|nr:hypothetical protein J6590_074416 [Homalodisca vitripennis]
MSNSDLENDDCYSEASSVLNNGSVVSTVPDRHGFLGGSQYSPEPVVPKVPLKPTLMARGIADRKRLSSPAVILKREQKWLHMLQNWEKCMSQNYKKCTANVPSKETNPYNVSNINSSGLTHCGSLTSWARHAAAVSNGMMTSSGRKSVTQRKDAEVHVGGFSLDNGPDVVIASPEPLHLDYDSDIIPATPEPCSRVIVPTSRIPQQAHVPSERIPSQLNFLVYDSERYCGAPLLFVRPLTVRERCRKGIPPSVRQRAWLYLCGAKLLMDQHPSLYTELCARPGDPRWVDDIRKDLHRQFPYHEMFVDQEGHGQKDLFNVLKAYSILNVNVGYCQAQAPLAAFLLTRMPAQEAFWCLVSICDNYLAGYYSQGMETLQIDGDILFGLLKKVARDVYKHLVRSSSLQQLYFISILQNFHMPLHRTDTIH